MNDAAAPEALVASGPVIEILFTGDQADSDQTIDLANGLRVAAEAALETARAGQSALTIVLTSDHELRALNRAYRGFDKPTNVLAFAGPDMAPHPDEPPYLGDVVLARDTVAREAHEQDKGFSHHASHLVVHGVLHLLGYTHDAEDDAARMEAVEVAALARLGLPDPYCDTTHA